MDWIVNLSKGDFIGRRSLRRADLRAGRKHLVGVCRTAGDLLSEGAQLVRSTTTPRSRWS